MIRLWRQDLRDRSYRGFFYQCEQDPRDQSLLHLAVSLDPPHVTLILSGSTTAALSTPDFRQQTDSAIQRWLSTGATHA